MISCGKKAYIRAHSLRAFLILCSYQEVCGTYMILEFMQILLWYWQTKQREFGDTVKFFSQLGRKVTGLLCPFYFVVQMVPSYISNPENLLSRRERDSGCCYKAS